MGENDIIVRVSPEMHRLVIKAIEREIKNLQDLWDELVRAEQPPDGGAAKPPGQKGGKPEAVGPGQRLRQAKLGVPPAPPPGPKSRVIREDKPPTKKRGRPRKVRHAVCQADIVKVLDKIKAPLTAFGIMELLETELSITVTEERVKAVLESGEGSKFFPTDDGKWGLAL